MRLLAQLLGLVALVVAMRFGLSRLTARVAVGRRRLWHRWALGELRRPAQWLLTRWYSDGGNLEGLQQQLFILVMREARRTRGGDLVAPTSASFACHENDYLTLTTGLDVAAELSAEISDLLGRPHRVAVDLSRRLTAVQGRVELLGVDFAAPTRGFDARANSRGAAGLTKPLSQAMLCSSNRTIRLIPGSTSLGRSLRNRVTVEGEKVSRRHAEIWFDGAGWLVRDLKSRNGTRVNDLRVDEVRLEAGDRVTIGDHVFVFELDHRGRS
ncbi:MAG: FHA domain-containing protein [Kineosporiaceae bacterium]|nr:FHA domain-containing protein [Kineosporiaceae bacterium]